MARALRYDNVIREIHAVQARRIVEIGTCQGNTAERMIRAALSHGGCEYVGFDLFELPPEQELSARKPPWPIERVQDRLGRFGADVRLVKGDTRDTLAAAGLQDVDLVFIDGGHSDETVRADFEAVLGFIRAGAPILFDDYWNYPGGGGCNALVDGLDPDRFDIDKLEPIDEFPRPYGALRTQIVRVCEKQ